MVKQEHEGEFEYLQVVFAGEVGTTFIQEDMRDPATFAELPFFFAADCHHRHRGYQIAG